MKYNRLGYAGIKVSELSYGSYLTFGEKMDFRQSKACMMAAFDHGINSLIMPKYTTAEYLNQ